MYYLKVFFLYSIVGHFLESTLYPTYDSGILYGYWTPIYGIGVVLILVIWAMLEKWIHPKKWQMPIYLFFCSAVLLAGIEWIGGYLIQMIFHKVFWNYQGHHFPIGLYTSLDMALIWGCASLAVVYLLKPITNFLVRSIPNWITFIVLGLFITDCLLKINTLL